MSPQNTADNHQPGLPGANPAREWLETIFEHTNDAIFVLDLKKDAIVEANPQACRLVGCSREELAGTPISAIHPGEMPEFKAFLEETVQKGRGWSDRFTCRRNDGRRLPCEISAAPVTTNGRTYILAHVRETTDRQKAQQWLSGQNKILEMIGSAAPLEKILQELCRTIEDLAPELRACVLVLDREQERFDRAIGPSFPDEFTAAVARFPPGPPHAGTCGQALADGETVLSRDVAGDDRWSDDWRDLSLTHDINACRSTPIRASDGATLGSLFLCFENPEKMGDQVPKVIDVGTHLASIALERRQAEAQIRRSRRELADFFEKATVPMHWVGPDGTVLRVNQAELDLLGYSREEVIGRHIAEFHADQEVIDDMLHRLTSGEELHDYEAHLERKDGSIRHVLISSNALWENGNFVHTRCITRDVTERKRAEKALRESKDRLAAKAADMERLHALSTRLFRKESVEAALQEVMEASAELLDADKASTQIYDDEEDVLRLAGVLDFDQDFIDQFQIVNTGSITTCAAALEQHEQVLVEDLSADPDYAEFYQTVKRYDARAAFSTPLYDSDGRLLGMFTMYWEEPRCLSEDELKVLDLYTRQAARHIERRRAAEKLKKTKEEAEKTARLRSNLMANVSHEIRTPITGILGLAEGLKEKVADARREEVRLIEKSGHRLMETLESVMALAQLEGGEVEISPELLNVTDVVEETAGSLRPLVEEKALSFEAISEAPGAKAHLDPALLGRILDNLVSNAVKFTDEGGITVRVSSSAEAVSIAVADTGVGISEEFKARLFEEFTQESTGLARSHEGIGLGLALTKKMTEQLGGEISVESEKGKGSTFTVTFPRADSAHEEGPEAPADDLPTDGRDAPTTAVLLMEDNEIIRRVIVERLEAKGDFDVQAFEKAEPALEKAAEQAFDVVLIDISLPGIDGIEALRRLQTSETYKDKPIIAVTGQALPGDRERFLEEGFSAYMGKPFSADELAEKIRALDT